MSKTLGQWRAAHSALLESVALAKRALKRKLSFKPLGQPQDQAVMGGLAADVAKAEERMARAAKLATALDGMLKSERDEELAARIAKGLAASLADGTADKVERKEGADAGKA